MKKSTFAQGFTFIELIIAIVIIGILSVIGIGSYTNSLKTSRDARRKVDIDSIRSALEQYKSGDVNSSYPQILTDLEGTKPGTTKYISLPVDPKTKLSSSYLYTPSPSGCDASTLYCTSYTLSTTLESKDNSMYQLDPFGQITPTP